MSNNTNTPKKNALRADKNKIATVFTVLLAVISAIVLWFFAIDYDSPDYSKTFTNIPIGVTGEGELRQNLGYTLLDQPSLTVDVTIAGKRTDVNRVRASDITAVIDLSSVAAAGENKFSVQITAPNGTTVSSQSVREIRLYVDNFVSRQFMVQVRNMSYVLAENLYIDTVNCSPATVTVWGPENELEKISGAYVDLELGELVNSVKATANVKLLDLNKKEVNNTYIFVENNTVTTSVSVYVEKDIPVKVNLTGGIFSSLTADIRCDLATVRFRGTVEQMENVREYVINVDETDTAFDSPIKLSINPPAGITNVSESKYATVLISVPDIGKRDMVISSKNIEFINIPEEYDAKALEDMVIQLRGLQDILDTITEEDISVTVDMSQLGEIAAGNMTVPVTVTVSNEEISGVFVYNKNAYTVQIVIK